MVTHTETADAIRSWATVALSWIGTGASFALDYVGPIAALVSMAYTIWQWRRQARRDDDERHTARELLKRLADEYATPFDELDTRPCSPP